MKKVLVLAFFSAIVFGACNKNKKLNKSLDGTWITTSMNGVSVTMADDPIQYQFSKSNKDGGTIKITYFNYNKVDNEYTGTYKISDEGKTLTIDATGTPNSNSGSSSTIHLVDVISHKEDKKFTVHETSNARRGFVFTDVFVFEKQ
jgi:asparagine N-glycosylation enzyme membrane subunit Stt3